MEKIEGAGQQCESIRRYTLTALTSGQNPKFNSYVGRIEDEVEAGTGVHSKMSWQDIAAAAGRASEPERRDGTRRARGASWRRQKTSGREGDDHRVVGSGEPRGAGDGYAH